MEAFSIVTSNGLQPRSSGITKSASTNEGTVMFMKNESLQILLGASVTSLTVYTVSFGDVFTKVCNGFSWLEVEPSPKSHTYDCSPEDPFVNCTESGWQPSVADAVNCASIFGYAETVFVLTSMHPCAFSTGSSVFINFQSSKSQVKLSPFIDRFSKVTSNGTHPLASVKVNSDFTCGLTVMGHWVCFTQTPSAVLVVSLTI